MRNNLIKTRPKLNISFEVGKRANVRLAHADVYGEMIREITSTRWFQDTQGLWFEWRWKPEQDSSLVGNFDCGFAGMLILNNDGSPSKYHQHFIKETTDATA